MEPSKLVIINDWDKPCIRLLMGIKDNGKAQYLNKQVLEHHDHDFELQPSSGTLEQFGFVGTLDEELRDWKYERVNPSIVKYADGTPRLWQDASTFYLSQVYMQEVS